MSKKYDALWFGEKRFWMISRYRGKEMKTTKGFGLWIFRCGDFLCGCLRANGTHKMLRRLRWFEQEIEDQHVLKSFP